MSEITANPLVEAPIEPYAGLMDRVRDDGVSLTDILSETGFEGLSPEGRLALIENATVDDYMAVTEAIHRKVAPEHSHEPHPEPVKFMSPKTGEVSGYAAKPEDRAGIMSYALETAKRVVQKYRQEGGSIEDALQRCGNVAAFGVVLAHIYNNGNGRTARAWGELIHNGYDGNNPESVSDLATLSANRPDEGLRINSYVPTGEWGNGRANQEPTAFLDAVAALDVPLDSSSYTQAVRSVLTTPRI